MKNIIAFGASNSSTSINKQLATYTANQLKNVSVTVLDLNDYEMPIYGTDFEKKNGIPTLAHQFLEAITNSDGIVLSMAEHNGNYSAAFKNIYDWVSRIEGKLWSNKPMLLMATSPGGRGGKSVLEIAQSTFPRMGADLISSFSLPAFQTNFTENGISDAALADSHKNAITAFQNAL